MIVMNMFTFFRLWAKQPSPICYLPPRVFYASRNHCRVPSIFTFAVIVMICTIHPGNFWRVSENLSWRFKFVPHKKRAAAVMFCWKSLSVNNQWCRAGSLLQGGRRSLINFPLVEPADQFSTLLLPAPHWAWASTNIPASTFLKPNRTGWIQRGKRQLYDLSIVRKQFEALQWWIWDSVSGNK